MASPNLDHPSFQRVKEKFPGVKMLATEFRGQATLVLSPENISEVMAFLKDDPACDFNFLSDVVGIDYQDYPVAQPLPDGTAGRFAVVYLLISHTHNRRLAVKVLVNPTRSTDGIEDDPGLVMPSMCPLWPGAEWPEREVFDMLGIRFEGHPDLRRILTWETYPAHPLRKDYPLRGRGERETFRVIDRDSA